ncbi:MAG: zf-TFIIB domain-containing protein [Planctomycetota bacterium]
MMPICPRCDKPLMILEFRGVEVDFCHTCRGVWLDRGELEAVAGDAGAHDPLLAFQNQPGVVPRGRKHLCPRCDAALHEIGIQSQSLGVSESRSQLPSTPGLQDSQTPGLLVDLCPKGHGLWFDKDELPRLVAMFPPGTVAPGVMEALKGMFGNKPLE